MIERTSASGTSFSAMSFFRLLCPQPPSARFQLFERTVALADKHVREGVDRMLNAPFEQLFGLHAYVCLQCASRKWIVFGGERVSFDTQAFARVDLLKVKHDFGWFDASVG